MESMNEGTNILDELNNEKRKYSQKENLSDMISRLNSQLANSDFKKMTSSSIENIMVQLNKVGDSIGKQLFDINKDNNDNESEILI